MGLIGFNKLSCIDCGRRFYSREKESLENKIGNPETDVFAGAEREKEHTSFESLIQKIEAAERQSGLKENANGKTPERTSEATSPKRAELSPTEEEEKADSGNTRQLRSLELIAQTEKKIRGQTSKTDAGTPRTPRDRITLSLRDRPASTILTPAWKRLLQIAIRNRPRQADTCLNV